MEATGNRHEMGIRSQWRSGSVGRSELRWDCDPKRRVPVAGLLSVAFASQCYLLDEKNGRMRGIGAHG